MMLCNHRYPSMTLTVQQFAAGSSLRVYSVKYAVISFFIIMRKKRKDIESKEQRYMSSFLFSLLLKFDTTYVSIFIVYKSLSLFLSKKEFISFCIVYPSIFFLIIQSTKNIIKTCV